MRLHLLLLALMGGAGQTFDTERDVLVIDCLERPTEN